MLKELLRPEIEELIRSRRWADLREALEEWPAPEVADFLLEVNKQDRVLLYRALPRAFAAEVFAYLEPGHQDALLRDLSDEESRQLLANLRPDDRTELLSELPGTVTQRLLNLLSPSDRKETSLLLGYPEESVGRLMTPDYIAVRGHWSVQEALDHIRRKGRDVETANVIYVIDAEWRLIGAVGLRGLVFADPGQRVEDIATSQVVSIPATADREEAVRVIQRYDLNVLPVVDSGGVLLGIITVDDVLDVAQEEATEDFQRVGGVAPVEIDYVQAGIALLWRKRIGWLMFLLVAQFLSSQVMAIYADALDKVVALAFFIPMLIGSGGNTGTQSATLIIRALATNQITTRDWWRIMRKEMVVGVLLGATLGAAVYIRGYFWSQAGPQVGLVVGVTMVALVISINLVGAFLPVVLARLRLDPAVVSSPFITTAADVAGLVIYFTIATLVLGL